MRRALLVVLAVGLVAGYACGPGGDGPLQFGIRRLALDIAFSDEALAEPAEPEVVVRLIPAPPEVLEDDFDFSSVAVPPDSRPLDLDLDLACRSAPPEATILLPASPAILDPPEPGTYLRQNSGWIELTGTGVPIRLPYPFISAWEISKAASATRPGAFGLPSAPTTATQFKVTKTLTPTFRVEETYEIGPEALLLIERVTIAEGARSRFRTDPPLEIFQYGAEGDSWVSAGVDPEVGVGVVVEARIADREVIDVCGDLIETFRLEYREQVVNLRTAETYGTDESQQSIINIAPQYGGVIVREELHTLQRTSTPDGSPVLVQFDYVSTLLSITP